MTVPQHRIQALLFRKRDGERHTPQEIALLVRAVEQGDILPEQLGAWLMAARIQGLDSTETVALTGEMIRGSRRFEWPSGGVVVDKHSTGGVGDKVSLVLMPLWLALGRRVPMLSGRGLGHTGGTVDKLESIPGFRCDLDVARLEQAMAELGGFLNGQTGEVAPADRIMYRTRDRTATVDSVGLITASILAKKIVEGIEELHLDVKVGSGGFYRELPRSRELAQSLVRVGSDFGVRTRALITDMSQPLGNRVGWFLEVQESVRCLRGEGPEDLRELVVALADDKRAAELLDSGAALETFERVVAFHGGDPAALRHEGPLDGYRVHSVRASKGGWVTGCDARSIGEASYRVGTAERAPDQPHRAGAGVVLHRKRGARVQPGDLLAEILHRGPGLEEAIEAVERAYAIGDAPPEPVPLIHEVHKHQIYKV